MIGQETIDRVRDATNLVALIGESVKLTRRGRSWLGLCPFHQEKTPSFHVNEERGFFHCFGCGAHGDGIRFLQDTEGLAFHEAVRRLADRAGVPIMELASEAERSGEAAARRRLEELYDANARAAAFFERALREHPLRAVAEAELARRGLVPTAPTDPIADALQAFRIGYAPYGWDGLSRHLRDASSQSAAEKAGLLVPRKSGGGYYDRFRHRLMFAVVDLQGRVVAFSGRVLPDPTPEELGRARLEPLGPSADREAKYVNSPESPIYKKRETVFGLFQARAEVRQRESCVLVEGNFDVVGLHARGVRNVVAPLGTAFTAEQARLVKRFAPSVTFLFDGDRAGRAAVTKSREPCREAGLIAKVATLPEGIDPDELARKGGAEAVRGVIGSAQGMIEYLIGVAVHGIQAASDAQTRAQRIRELGQLIATEDDPAVRAMAEQYADGVVARLGISDARTFRALSELVRQAAAREPRPGEMRANGAKTSTPGANAFGSSANAPSPASNAPSPVSSAPGGVSSAPSSASTARASTTRALPANSLRPFDPRRPPATGGARLTPMRARSRDRREDIVLGVLGALLDFPELVEDNEVQAALGVLEDEAALAAVVIRRAWESAGPRGDRKDPRRFGEQVLANVEGSIQKFAGARLTAPESERLEDARAELLTNAEKLRAIELARHRSAVVEGLQRAQATGDHAQELELLEERQRMLQDRAKEFSRRLPQRDGDSWSSSNPFELSVGGGTRSES